MLKPVHDDADGALLLMLIELRQRKRIRQIDLAARLGKSQATVSKVERGVRPLGLMELRQWLSVLEIDFMSFMNELGKRLASAPQPDVPIGRQGGSAGDMRQDLAEAIAALTDVQQPPGK